MNLESYNEVAQKISDIANILISNELERQGIFDLGFTKKQVETTIESIDVEYLTDDGDEGNISFPIEYLDLELDAVRQAEKLKWDIVQALKVFKKLEFDFEEWTIDLYHGYYPSLQKEKYVKGLEPVKEKLKELDEWKVKITQLKKVFFQLEHKLEEYPTLKEILTVGELGKMENYKTFDDIYNKINKYEIWDIQEHIKDYPANKKLAIQLCLAEDVKIHLNQMDWEMLRLQKLELVTTISKLENIELKEGISLDSLEGLVNFIDEIQDQAAKCIGEEVVFGKLTKENNLDEE